LVLALLSVILDGYVGTQLSENSKELAGLGVILQKEMETTAVGEAEQIKQRMDLINQNAAGLDAKVQKWQDDFVARMNKELPPLVERTMDNYIKTHGAMIAKEAMRQVQH
jgi:hypothetical protein